MTTTHTPGPWIAKEQFDDNDDSLGIAITAGREDLTFIQSVGEIDFANARLMAAAPELLEALKDALAAMESGKIYSSTINNARVAIAKAGGAA